MKGTINQSQDRVNGGNRHHKKSSGLFMAKVHEIKADL
jgi:hypothetical protein